MASNNGHISRREFLGKTTQFTVGAVAAGMLASCAKQTAAPLAGSRIIGANGRINIAIIGIRGRGMYLAEGFAKIPNVSIKTFCDIDANLFAERVKKIEDIQKFGRQRKKTSGGFSMIRISMPCSLRRRITGMRLRQSGHVNRVSMFMSRSPLHTISGKGVKWSRRQTSMAESCSAASRTAPSITSGRR